MVINSENRKYFNVRNIEMASGVPAGLLSRYLDGKRGISEKHLESVGVFLSGLFGGSVVKEQPKEPIKEVVTVKDKVVERKPVKKAKNEVVVDVVKPEEKHKLKSDAKRLPDMNPDGSFNKSKWEKVMGFMVNGEFWIPFKIGENDTYYPDVPTL